MRVVGGNLCVQVQSQHAGKFVAIDIETGAYELDADQLAAFDRLLARLPGAQECLRRVGSHFAHRFGVLGLAGPQSSGPSTPIGKQ
jgi:hypothetical protein